MNINFAMWKTALWTLVKMDKKDRVGQARCCLQVADRHPLRSHIGDRLHLRHCRDAGLA